MATSSNVHNIRSPGSLFTQKISLEDAVKMIVEVSDDEIKSAMFAIGDNKALGLDGYTAMFFKSAWFVVGTEVFAAIKRFFHDGVMP